MQAMNCPKCGRVFSSMGAPICPACTKKEEELFTEVKRFLAENKGATMTEVSEATGATKQKILRYIKEGRLEATKGMDGEVTCEGCGKKITRGKCCESCLVKLDGEIKSLFATNNVQKKSTISKMHMQKKL